MNLFAGYRIIIVMIGIIMISGYQQLPSSYVYKNQTEIFHDVESPNILDIEEKDSEKIVWLEKVGEIKDGFCDEEYNYFLKITSLCIDNDDNLYIADSGLHRIFIFNNHGEFISSFGSQGQGPGEFLGTLRISMGNNGNLYVNDDGNWRLLIFSKGGKFIHQFPITNFLRDEALVNSKGEIYMLSPSRIKIIDFFDSNMNLNQSLLEMNYQLNFFYKQPPKKMLTIIQKPSILNIKKLLTKEDQLIVVFNNSHRVVIFDNNHKIIKEFSVEHPRFIRDYKERLKNAISKGIWVNSFGSVFLDHKENLCFCYYNASLGLPEIYRYRQDGTFINTLRAKNFKEITGRIASACDGRGNFFSISSGSTKVRINRLAK